MFLLKNYIFNLETTKIELHFDKDEYDALTEEQKKILKSAFLFSSKSKAWISRAKEPNLFNPKQMAKKLGFIEELRVNDRLAFAEQVEKKAKKAEARADRYEVYAEKAEARAEGMQSILDKRGDISFFTQPIIQGHSGSIAFGKQREKMMNRYIRGFEEYRKSEYFKSKADISRQIVDGLKLKDKSFLDRRIKECQKNIRAYERNLIKEEERMKEYEIDPDANKSKINELIEWFEGALEYLEVMQDKEAFYLNLLDDLGGLQFNKDNVKIGDRVLVKRYVMVS